MRRVLHCLAIAGSILVWGQLPSLAQSATPTDTPTATPTAGTMLVGVQTIDPGTLPAPPAEASGLPLGVLSFRVAGVTPGGTVEVEIFPASPVAMSSYYKFAARSGWSPLIGGAVGQACTRCTAPEVETYLSGLSTLLDVDADGTVGALTDGLLVLRFLFGFSGASLTTGTVSPDCTRCGAADVEPYLSSLVL